MHGAGFVGPEWMILAVLLETDGSGGLRADMISERLGLNVSFVTAHSRDLEKRGVVRLSVAHDPRATRLWLTEMGRRRLAAPTQISRLRLT